MAATREEGYRVEFRVWVKADRDDREGMAAALIALQNFGVGHVCDADDIGKLLRVGSIEGSTVKHTSRLVPPAPPPE